MINLDYEEGKSKGKYECKVKLESLMEMNLKDHQIVDYFLEWVKKELIKEVEKK